MKEGGGAGVAVRLVQKVQAVHRHLVDVQVRARHRLGRSGGAGGEEDAVHVPGLDRIPRGNESLRCERLQHVFAEDRDAEVATRVAIVVARAVAIATRTASVVTPVVGVATGVVAHRHDSAERPRRHALQPAEQGAVRDHELRIGQIDHVLQDRAPVGRIHRRVHRAEHHESQHEPHHHGTVVQPHQDPVAALHPERLERGGGAAGDVPGVGVRPGIAAIEHHQRAIAQALGLRFEDAGQDAATVLEQRGGQIQQAPVRHVHFRERRRAGRCARRTTFQACVARDGRSPRLAGSISTRVRGVK